MLVGDIPLKRTVNFVFLKWTTRWRGSRALSRNSTNNILFASQWLECNVKLLTMSVNWTTGNWGVWMHYMIAIMADENCTSGHVSTLWPQHSVCAGHLFVCSPNNWSATQLLSFKDKLGLQIVKLFERVVIIERRSDSHLSSIACTW